MRQGREAAGVARARRLVDATLHLAAIADHPVAPQDIDLFHTVAWVLVPPGLSLGFPPTQADLVLDPELERLNFRELPRGTAFARVQDPSLGIGLQVLDEDSRDVASRFFHREDGEVRLRRPVMPAMLT